MLQHFAEADILENALLALSPDILNHLLQDQSRSTREAPKNIRWATDDYVHLGEGYGYTDPIQPELITGEHGHVVMPRVKKQKNKQAARSREMAEVFTPSWICNAQNNLIDETWFGRSNVFNEEIMLDNGTHSWRTVSAPIGFPEGKTWLDYVKSTRLEITCGEAPYLVSRYDTTTGDFIPLPDRIGLLDRKLRVINENVHNEEAWLEAAQQAYRHTYAYEWQGDSLLLAREALLVSFIEYHCAKFGHMPSISSIDDVAVIVSWNVWQMDGLKGVVPGTCSEKKERTNTLWDGIQETVKPCTGCKSGRIKEHIGDYCYIKDWDTTDPATGENGMAIRFIDLLQQ